METIHDNVYADDNRFLHTITPSNTPKFFGSLELVNKNQKWFYDTLSNDSNRIVMCHAPAGCGKTHISIYKALERFYRKEVKRIIIINPTVDTGNESPLGFLPGDINAKIGLYNESADFIFEKLIGEQELTKLKEKGKVQYKALNFLRGTNLENSFIIMDEAQNTSPLQLKTLMTRIDDTTTLVLQGDLGQCDKYNDYKKSGFFDVWDRLKQVHGVDYVEFTPDDIVRSRIVRDILKTYYKQERIILNGISAKYFSK